MKGILKSEVGAGGYGEKWKNESDSSVQYYTANDIIDAYESGAKDGEKRILAQLTKIVRDQTILAMHSCEEIWTELIGRGIEPISVHLKKEAVSAYVALFVIGEAQYLDEKFDDTYASVLAMVDKINSKDFHLGIHFLPISEEFNKELILADGFVYSYNNK
jgi:hypothetical protein